MTETRQTNKRRRRDDVGASLVEYALLIALIAFVCLGALTAFGITNGGSINRSTNSIVAATN